MKSIIELIPENKTGSARQALSCGIFVKNQ
jgi:hypothetical protein